MKKLIASTLSIAIVGMSLVGCQKDLLKEEPVPQQPKSISKAENGWWIIVAAAVVKIVADLAEGQARNVTYYENGNIKSYDCMSVGTCHIANGRVASSGNPISTVPDIYSGDYTVQNIDIVKTNDGKVLLGIDQSEDSHDLFFYDSNRINISVPYIIDSPEVLNPLGETEPIVIGGEYNVLTDGTTSYIVLKP
ncbi:MAG: hypothetical protein LPK47_04890 [Bacteroidota bacterium]|nr:hypothetical protein [Bacteroidota bacterium]